MIWNCEQFLNYADFRGENDDSWFLTTAEKSQFIKLSRMVFCCFLLAAGPDMSWLKDWQEMSSSKRTTAAKAREDADGKWRAASAAIREKLKVSPFFNPWTRKQDFQAVGISVTPRIADLLDVITAERLSRLKLLGKPLSDNDIEEAMSGCYADVSQSHQRRSCSYPDRPMPTVCTSTCLYSFALDSIILPIELFMLHGFPRTLKFSDELGISGVKSLVGNGMCAPCLAQALMSLYAVLVPVTDTACTPVQGVVRCGSDSDQDYDSSVEEI